MLWLIGWLFSIGYLKLGFWKGVLALFVWPYFIGADIADLRTVKPGAPVTVEQTDRAL
ncbi:MAG: hypothetical protein HKP25_01245 [Marinicaulis sp.]|nr:hypothetical protein [Marinicaulis sp.]